MFKKFLVLVCAALVTALMVNPCECARTSTDIRESKKD